MSAIEFEIIEERTIHIGELEGHDLIKIFRKLPITINKLKNRKINGRMNSVYSVPTDNRFKCTWGDSTELEIWDYDTFPFTLEHYVLKIQYHYWDSKIKKFYSYRYEILLNDRENDLIREMIEF
jgi:hypothetical protein